MALIHTLFAFLVAIVLLVSIHEWGHFFVARLCGVKVLRFSLGFGKVLFRWHDKLGTEFSLSALPLGGYVKMLDEREGDVADAELSQAFNRKKVWQRMAIVLAGPVANFLLAIVLFWFLLLGGEKGLIPIVGKVHLNSMAAQAGLESGQEIVAVDGELTPTEQALGKQLLTRLGESGDLLMQVRYPNSSLQYDLVIHLERWMQGAQDPDPLTGLGIELAFPLKAIVGELVKGAPAEKAGFKLGDKLVRVDATNIDDWRTWVDYVYAHPAKIMHVEIVRGGETMSLEVTSESFADKGVSHGRVGMAVAPPDESLFRNTDYTLGGAFVASVQKTLDTAGFVLLSVKKLILGEISTKNLSGPISIAKVAGSSAQQGIISFIGFIALLSVFLGVFNLLPVPVLDGGHMVYLLAEVVQGKPVSEKIQMLASQLGLALVVSLSVLAMYNDIMRL